MIIDKNNPKIKICYFGICDMTYSRNRIFSQALLKKGAMITECTSKEKGFKRYIDLYRKHKAVGSYDVMIVGFPGFVIAPFARLISRKKVILDALSSRYDSDIVSRNAHEGSFLRKIKILFVDRLAFACSHKILVESEAQKDFISKKFKINKNKIEVVFTGVDETVFKKLGNNKSEKVRNEKFTVLFRGRIMNEAGVPTIMKAAELLKAEEIYFDIIGYGWGPWVEDSRELYKRLDHAKVYWDEKEIPINKLIERMQKADISLGQFGRNNRVDRTIPHKAFEAIIMGIPYITSHSKAVSEILKDGESCIMIDLESPEQLAKVILKLRNDSELRGQMVVKAYEAYDQKCDSVAIGERLMNIVYSLL